MHVSLRTMDIIYIYIKQLFLMEPSYKTSKDMILFYNLKGMLCILRIILPNMYIFMLTLCSILPFILLSCSMLWLHYLAIILIISAYTFIRSICTFCREY